MTEIERLTAQLEAAEKRVAEVTREWNNMAAAIEGGAAELAAMTWRPMATAPKDGTRVLVSVCGSVFLAWWCDSLGWIDAKTTPVPLLPPDRWQPLQAAWKAPVRRARVSSSRPKE